MQLQHLLSEPQFKFQLLDFQSSSLLNALGRQEMGAQIFVPLLPMWETRMTFQAPGPSLIQLQLLWPLWDEQAVDERSLSSVSPLLCHSNIEINKLNLYKNLSWIYFTRIVSIHTCSLIQFCEFIQVHPEKNLEYSLTMASCITSPTVLFERILILLTQSLSVFENQVKIFKGAKNDKWPCC